MAKLFRPPVRQKDPATGRRVPKLDGDGNPVLYRRWSAVVTDHLGRRLTRAFTENKKESQMAADLLEARELEIRLGLRPAPAAWAGREYGGTVAEYLAWGNRQGGRGGRPWSRCNAAKRAYYMAWWGRALGLRGLGDLNGRLADAERALRGLADLGRAGKTLNLYREALRAFCRWCRDRDLLPEDPFRRMARFDDAVLHPRRALPPADIARFLAACRPDMAMLYETALATGFRAGELRSLSRESLRPELGGIRLSAEVDKGRRERLQPVTADLLRRLAEYGATGAALELYRTRYIGRRLPAGLPARPLLYVPASPYRSVYRDLRRAGIPDRTGEGKVDFHALRTAYINLVVDSGADLKTAQTLARHTDPTLTMNVYARAKRDRLADTAETVGRAIAGRMPDSPRQAPEQEIDGTRPR